MPLLEALETRALFRLARLVAFTIILFLTAALVIGSLVFFKDLLPNNSGRVEYGQISAELSKTKTPKSDDS